MVNDITALTGDPAMASICATAGCDVVLMHMRGTPKTMQHAPHYDDVISEVLAFFDERILAATEAGIAYDRIWIDPGFGFGKSRAHNLELLRRLRDFTVLGRPILVGTSNKSTIGAVLGGDPGDRMEGTAATVAISVFNGASAVRVHDVRTMAKVAKMTDAICRGA
jgi:dihydropteroate synthase